MIRKIKTFLERYWVIATVLYVLIMLLIASCENTYKPNTNYRYTFSGVSHKDNIGRKVYGSHYFTLDEPIKDMESFKECYVNYLDWSGLDKEGLYKKNFYQDRKNVKIYLTKEVWGRVTVTDADLCN